MIQQEEPSEIGRADLVCVCSVQDGHYHPKSPAQETAPPMLAVTILCLQGPGLNIPRGTGVGAAELLLN